MHRQTKATSIPASVKAAVAIRDHSTCIICGAPGGPHCHVVRRSQGGRGDTERNIVTLCDPCHMAMDQGLFLSRLQPLGLSTQREVQEYVFDYMRALYPNWTPESMKYHKYGEEP